MSRILKFLFGTAIVLTVLIGVAIALAVMFFPSEKIRALAEEKATEALGVDVTVGDAGLSFAGIPSVVIGDVTVGDADGDEPPLFTLESAKVRVDLFKLLKKKVDIVLIDIEKPVVNLITRADSTTNLPVLPENTGQKEKKAGPPALPVPVSLRSLIINNASVVLDSRAVNGSVIAVNDIDIAIGLHLTGNGLEMTSDGSAKIGDISLTDTRKESVIDGVDASFEYVLEGDAATGDFTLSKGDLSVNGIPVAVTADLKEWTRAAFGVKADGLDIETVLRAAPEGVIPDRDKLTAQGTFSLNVDGVSDTSADEPVLTYTGALDVDISRLVFEGLPKSVDGVSSHIGFTETRIDIRDADVKIGGSRFSLSGTVNDYTGDPDVALKASGDIDLADIRDAVPMPEGMDMSGGVTFDADLEGRPSNIAGFTAKGGATADNVTVVMPETFKQPAVVNAAFSLSPDAMKVEKLDVVSGDTDLQFSGRVTNYMALAGLGEGTAKFTGVVRSKLIDINGLLVTKETEEPAATKPWDLEETVRELPIPPTLSGELRAFLGAVKFGKLKADSVSGRIVFADGIVELKGLKVEAYGGSLTGSTAINMQDFENVNYGGDFKLNAFDSAGFLSDFLDANEFLRGTLSSSMSFSGAGLDSTSMFDNFKASGDMSFKDGQFVNFGLTKKLGEKLPFLDFDTFDFESMKNTFKVEDRKFITPDMALTTDYGDIEVDGFTGFNTAIDYTITLDLDRETSKKALESLSSLSKYVDAVPERLELVVDADGTLTSPSIKLDTSAAETLLKDALKDRAKDEIDKLLDSEDAQKLKKKGQDLLKGLFKKD